MSLEIFLRGRWQLLANEISESSAGELIFKANKLGWVVRRRHVVA